MKGSVDRGLHRHTQRAGLSRRGRARGWMTACPPRSPTATSPPRTACCPTRRGPSSAASPSASTSTSRSAACAAATATSTPTPPHELGDEVGASRSTYAEAAIREIRFARHVLGHRDVKIETIFFGGGTPTLLKPADLGAIVASAAAEFGLADGVEITTEANPDSVAAWDLEELRTAGFNRISFGMQSAVDHVLRTLDRTHDPMRVPAAVDWARQAGFDDVSLDLIYGTPGESLADWETSVEAALACEPDHVSAYSLIVEDGTALARQVKRGELPMPDEDDLADKYHLADERFSAAGLGWYEVSNWATSPEPLVPAQPALLDRRRTGGASARARTPTSAACAGGTSSTPRRTPTGWRAASQPGPGARGARLPRPAASSGSCSRSASSRGSRSPRSRPPGRSHVARLVADGLRRARRRAARAHPARPAPRRRRRARPAA